MSFPKKSPCLYRDGRQGKRKVGEMSAEEYNNLPLGTGILREDFTKGISKA